jgi:hypothetical protein
MTSWLSKLVPQVVLNLFNTSAAQAPPLQEPFLPPHSSPPHLHSHLPILLPTHTPHPLSESTAASDFSKTSSLSHLHNTCLTPSPSTHSHHTQARRDALNLLTPQAPSGPSAFAASRLDQQDPPAHTPSSQLPPSAPSLMPPQLPDDMLRMIVDSNSSSSDDDYYHSSIHPSPPAPPHSTIYNPL